MRLVLKVRADGSHLSEYTGLKPEEAEQITDIVEMVQEELKKPEPKPGRLRNALTTLAPMMTIANGIPVLCENLQKLIDYISACL